MKNIKFTILGVATLLIALTLNFRHALDDYGVLDNKLHVEVFAQTNTGGGTTNDYLTGARTNTGSCTFGSTTTFTYSQSEVNLAKLALGAEASTSDLAKWLLKAKIDAQYDGQEQSTTSGGLQVSFSSGGQYSYGWIQCLGQNTTPCTPVSPLDCQQ